MLKSAILRKTRSPLTVEKLTAFPIERGQVFVRVEFSGVCRSQLMEVRGKRGHDPWLPHLLGHEASGQVLEIGVGVTKVKPGDYVVLSWIKGSGLDAPGAKYICNGEVIHSGPVTTFSTHTIVSENRVTVIPEGFPLDQAVLLGCALPTGAGMVFNQAKPPEGSSVAVIGLGGVGLSALMALRSFRCGCVIAIDKSIEKLEFAKTLGATHLIQEGVEPVEQKVMDLTKGGVDFCLESAGSVESIELGFKIIKKNGGKLWFASHPPEGEMVRLHPHDLISGKQIFGTWGGGCVPDRDFPLFAKEFIRNQIPLDRLLSKRYRLEEVNEALDDLELGKVFRPLLVMR
jgi:S-(hydroxymethyl)glutathione dehydrogenase/alcohol dehydrogenase